MSNKFSPGPWKLDPSSCWEGKRVLVRDKTGYAVIQANYDLCLAESGLCRDATATMMANARLAAEAPELLRLLKRALGKIVDNGDNHKFLDAAWEVVAKAEGRKS